MKKYKKLSKKDLFNVEYRIIRLILAGGDWCVNVEKDYATFWRSPNNPYYCEGFGLLHALNVLGYGYFGAENDTDVFNLQNIRHRCEDSAIYLMTNYGPKRAYQMVAYELEPFDSSCIAAVKGQTLTNEFIKNFYKNGTGERGN